MLRWKIFSAALLVALLGSNLWWAYAALDRGSIVKAKVQQADDLRRQACDATDVAMALGRGMPRDTVVLRVQEALADSGFVKDGGHHIGALMFTFDEAGNLRGVESSITPRPCDGT